VGTPGGHSPARPWPSRSASAGIRALRERAAAALGDDFDVRAFHRRVLGGGPLPLDLLEQVIERWIAGSIVAAQPKATLPQR
jgi:hypothetical protein